MRVRLDVWVCASETLGSRWPYKDLLERTQLHVAMVDLCWTGGLTEGRKIASLAETWHRPFAPHDCIGPVGFVAAVHMSFSQPNTLIQESVRAFYRGWYNELVTVLPRIENGCVYPMEGPGLGVELQPAVFKRQDLTVRRTPAVVAPEQHPTAVRYARIRGARAAGSNQVDAQAVGTAPPMPLASRSGLLCFCCSVVVSFICFCFASSAAFFSSAVIFDLACFSPPDRPSLWPAVLEW